MSRPTRIQFPGALYHVYARGNRRGDLYLDERDYLVWLDHLASTVERFAFSVHAYCLMPNHYHLVMETTAANLSDGMHFLNCGYAQHFNKRHKLVGHVTQGRFHAILLDWDCHLLELSRYLPLNPVRAGLVAAPECWRWSSYRAIAGLAYPPGWLQAEWTLRQFSDQPEASRAAFQRFVHAGHGMTNPLLGASEKTSLQGGVPTPLREFERQYTERSHAIAAAYQSKGYSMREVADYFGVSLKTVGRAVKRYPTPF
jgi:putative transposase